MTKISKKAILSILSLVLTFVALGATTFAWFSLGTTATVEKFEVQVTGSEGLEISLGDSNQWYTNINSTVMRAYIASLVEELDDAELNDDGDFVMDAVTTEDGISFFRYNTTTTTVDDVSTTTFVHTGNEANKNVDYLSLNIKLRTKNKQKINLTNLIVGDNGEADNWVVDQEFTLAKNNEHVAPALAGQPAIRKETHLADALRISVVTKGETEAQYVFEKDDVGSTNTTGTLAMVGVNYIGAFQYFAKKTGYGTANNILLPAAGFNPKQADSLFGENINKEVADFTQEEDLTTGYYEIDLVVNIWFEGYDNEAFDAVLDQLVNIILKFDLVN